MKWTFLILFMIFFNQGPINAQMKTSPQNNVHIIRAHFNISNDLTIAPLLLNQTTIQQTNEPHKKTVADYVTFILLWITTLLTIITPLILIYLWLFYSSIYVKKYRRIFSVKKWIFGKSNLINHDFSLAMRLSFRKIYSLMVGFGIAIIAYSFASIRFMVRNFDKMETAMVEYFRFPFLVLDEFGLMQTRKEIAMQFENFWNEMLLIVVISGMFFLIGYLLGSLVVDLRFKLLNKQAKKTPLMKISTNKEMFSLKTEKEQTLHA